VLLDQEEKVVVNQRVLDMDNQLVALIAYARVLCNVMLSIG
jgi:hypothetical protein